MWVTSLKPTQNNKEGNINQSKNKRNKYSTQELHMAAMLTEIRTNLYDRMN
jgi:hypothetical protein